MSTRTVPPDQWTDPRHRAGWQAELLASRWLAARGWQVEHHRFRWGHHDLDLIARRGDIVAFVEVKWRRSTACGGGEESIGRRKRLAIERAAWSWILRFGSAGECYRFDVIVLSRRRIDPARGFAISPVGSGSEGAAQAPNGTDPVSRWRTVVRYIEDAWRPGWR